MKRSSVVWIVAALGALALVYFGKSSWPKQPNANLSSSQPALKVITAKRQYSNGHHVITGSIDLPTPCHGLSIETTITHSEPEQVALNFISSTTAQECQQVETSVQFRDEFQASGYAVIRAYWNGEPAKLQFTN